jgi:D-alanyl-D-alanine dipeptidase
MTLRTSIVFFFLALALTLQPGQSLAGGPAGTLPKGFVYADEMIPDLLMEMRYAGSHNFLGELVDGYRKQRCILTREAAEALKMVQAELRPFGLGVKVSTPIGRSWR